MQIVVLGAGAIGSIVAAHLAQAGEDGYIGDIRV